MTISRYIDIVMSDFITRSKALSDETRVVLLDLLLRHELAVGEIVEALQMGQSRISRHLKILHDAGLVALRRDGLWSFYRAVNDSFVAALTPFMEEDFLLQAHRVSWRGRIAGIEEGRLRYFDSLAPELSAVKHDILGGSDPGKAVVEALPPVQTVADLGCGTGELFGLLRDKASRIIGIDRSEKMLEGARLRANGNASIELRIGALEHLPLRDGEVDAAVMSLVLHYLADPALALAEAVRALRRGGCLIVAELDRHGIETLRNRYGHRRLGFTRDEMAELFGGAGFSITSATTFDAKQGLSVTVYRAEQV